MADFDTVVIRDREDEYIHLTLGPEGHNLSRMELLRLAASIKKSFIEASDSSFEEIDTNY